ncbi:MAG: hypothetical protein DRH08_14330 [Deltaproteobacteria bacterium]|nr:MAG: hypothetical protein DRH08_14330 [Deltaproteobacteria bacterium]
MPATKKDSVKSPRYYSESNIFEKQKTTMYAALGLIQYEADKASFKWNSIIINQKSIYDEQLQDK